MDSKKTVLTDGYKPEAPSGFKKPPLPKTTSYVMNCPRIWKHNSSPDPIVIYKQPKEFDSFAAEIAITIKRAEYTITDIKIPKEFPFENQSKGYKGYDALLNSRCVLECLTGIWLHSVTRDVKNIARLAKDARNAISKLEDDLCDLVKPK